MPTNSEQAKITKPFTEHVGFLIYLLTHSVILPKILPPNFSHTVFKRKTELCEHTFTAKEVGKKVSKRVRERAGKRELL